MLHTQQNTLYMSRKEQQPHRLQELGPPQEVQFRACWKLSTAAFPSQTAQGLLAVTFLALLQEDWQLLEKPKHYFLNIS